ncbi:MAG: DNA gyrase inhibitor YacG [Gammaproteobacteria bacterium]|nr:DNA gyrase inhibitor YacG [Gammaproteobacteria bacterium]
MKSKTVKCPTCEKPVEWKPENLYRPFCNERCKLIDLGAWADESHRIASAPTQDFIEQTPQQNDELH